MPGRREPDGGVGHSFGLELDGVRVSMLTEVLGLTVEREVVEFREGGADGTQVVRKLPGRTKSGEVTVVRGLTTEPTFEQWMRDVTADADAGRRTVAILVLDRKGQRVATFTLTRAWPRKLEYAGLRAGAPEPVTERLTLVHDGIART
ncbi:phage tail protein [Knoellia sp. LjRoot47]|uniref:phage tail protein n=1 Tax=Knoellia sp. LjRoot47 TaxID=3342330 RepID=UPI003ECD8145